MPQVELSQGCSMLGLPRSHRTKAQMAESIVAHLQETASKPADIQDTSDPSSTDPLKPAQVKGEPGILSFLIELTPKGVVFSFVFFSSAQVQVTS